MEMGLGDSDRLRWGFDINLDNFEDYGLAQTTPYVLTSPRSLRACEQFFIKPTDLVYHSLEEYEESLPYLKLSEIYKIYDENETERQEKLLKCREMRKVLASADTYRRKERVRISNSASDRATSSANNSVRSRSRRSRSDKNHSDSTSEENRKPKNGESQRGKSRKVRHCSETESLADENEEANRCQEEQNQCQIYSSKSVPDLRRHRSNLDFQKISPLSWSPRLCTFGPLRSDDKILEEYMIRYGDGISMDDLTRDDRKILELLLLKKGREMERDKLSHEIRGAIENDRMKRIQETNLWNQRWQDRLSEKRRLENIENGSRFMALENQWRNNRQGLLTYLDARDAKVQKYLDDLQYQRKKQMLEKHQHEALRQLEVGRAIDKLLEDDRHHRQALAQKLQVRMREAEMRKRRKEQDTWRHIQEMNRLEEMKRVLKQEQMEIATQKSIDELRSQLQEKNDRASMNYLNRVHARNALMTQGAGNRNKCLERARALHAELLTGLDEWHRKVLDLQVAAQERATQNYTHEISRRQARVASERALREERSLEMLRRVKEKEEKQRELVMDLIETKNSKSARVKAEKERKIHYSRLRAQLGAEMRQKLRERLNPDSFDKKAARAEIELQLFKKSQPWFNRKIGGYPETNSKVIRHYRPSYCSCKCRKC